ncbi:MAG TPA: hypothetical protein VGL06_18870, partial [Pseudonocardiaceae bacterium]
MTDVLVPGTVDQITVDRIRYPSVSPVIDMCLDASRPADDGFAVRRNAGVIIGWWRVGQGRPAPDRRDGLQQSGSDLGPPDQQEWADGIERGFAVAAGDDGVGDVECEGGEAGEDEQSAHRAELGCGGALEGEMSGAHQEAQDGEVDYGGDQGRDPDWD